MKHLLACCFLMVASSGISLALAEEVPARLQPSTQNQPPQATDTLTQDRFLSQVRANHPKLFSADIQRRIAGARLLERQGAFDPGISLDTDYLRYNDFTQRGKVSKTFDNDLSLNWQTRSGLKFSTGARYNTGDVKPPLYPTGNTGEYFMGVRMPLLRGFRINDRVAAEMRAQLGIPLADADFTEARLDLLIKASDAYWDWVAARRKMGVSEAILKLADFRRDAITDRVNAGDLPKIDATEAAQEVVRRQGSLVKAQREYQKAVFKLSLFLWEADGKPSPLPQETQVPEKAENPIRLTDDEWMEGRQVALDSRPELQAFNIEKQITEVDLRYAKNLRLPILDLIAQPGIDTGDNSIGPTLKAGIALMVPLRQRTAQGLQMAAEYRLQKLDLDQRFQLQEILLQVDDAVSAVNAAYDQFQAAKQEYSLAKDLEIGEKQRFEAGDSTLFLINQRERASAEAAFKMIDTEAEYNQSLAIFNIVTGKWL